ncbi:hypothetical protein U1Q18_045948 [Sarracenia purpurea var. burkii]
MEEKNPDQIETDFDRPKFALPVDTEHKGSPVLIILDSATTYVVFSPLLVIYAHMYKSHHGHEQRQHHHRASPMARHDSANVLLERFFRYLRFLFSISESGGRGSAAEIVVTGSRRGRFLRL